MPPSCTAWADGHTLVPCLTQPQNMATLGRGHHRQGGSLQADAEELTAGHQVLGSCISVSTRTNYGVHTDITVLISSSPTL